MILHFHRLHKGFSLLELSVVLIIISLILGAGINLGSNAIKTADRVSTQQKLAVIQKAIESFNKANGYLPCPAFSEKLPSDPEFGFELRQEGTYDCNVNTLRGYGTLLHVGAVPVRTLGLPDSYAADAWANKFTYGVSNGDTGLIGQGSNGNHNIQVMTGDVTGVSYPLTTTNAGRNPSVPTDFTPGSGASYAVVSHGPDGKGAFPLRGKTQIPCIAGPQNDVVNCNFGNGTDFWDTAYNDNPNQPNQFFDDFIVWGKTQFAKPAMPVNSSSCPVGRCESWCAPCAGMVPNIPYIDDGGSGMYAHMAANPNRGLCQKIITSTSPCQATCIWSFQVWNGNPSNTQITRCP